MPGGRRARSRRRCRRAARRPGSPPRGATEATRRRHPIRGPTMRKNGVARITVSRAVDARPTRSPLRNALRRRPVRRCACSVAAGSAGGGVVGAEREPHRQHRQADGDDVRLVPRGRVLCRVPEHRPEGEEDGGPQPDHGRDPSRPIIHQHSATSTAARTVKINWSSARSPKAATNGTSRTAGSGGNGISARSLPPARPMGSTSWKK